MESLPTYVDSALALASASMQSRVLLGGDLGESILGNGSRLPLVWYPFFILVLADLGPYRRACCAAQVAECPRVRPGEASKGPRAISCGSQEVASDYDLRKWPGGSSPGSSRKSQRVPSWRRGRMH